MNQVDLIYFDAGGGHRASALALQAMIEQQQRPWTIRLINLREVLDPDDKFRRTLGISLEDAYNYFLAKGWTAGAALGLKLLQGIIRLGHAPMVRRLQAYWQQQQQPDLVVSLIPNFNHTLYCGLKTALPTVPFVTVLTDLADYPPHFWIEPAQRQSFICGSAKAAEQARAQADPAAQIHQTSGMMLRPKFYQTTPIVCAVELEKLGFDPARPTGLVLFGGSGAKAMLTIAKQLPDTQLIMVCGHNQALAEKLRALPIQAPRHVVGFTQDIPFLMQMADFFIGKPGPGSISEAVRMNLPVIVECNRHTLPQERYNAQWVQDNNVGVVLKNFQDVPSAVQTVCQNLAHYQANTRRLDNRAIFEVPDILDAILKRHAV